MKPVFAVLLLLTAPSGVFAADHFSAAWPPVLAAGSAPGLPTPLPAVPLKGSARDAAAVAGHLSVWTQDCPGGACAIPQGAAPARTVKFEMALPASAGEARAKTVVEEYDLAGAGRLRVKLSFYSVCPYGSVEGCPARYFQVQAELSGAADAFCAASLNAADFFPFPVFMCAGNYLPGKRLGVTLHRQPL